MSTRTCRRCKIEIEETEPCYCSDCMELAEEGAGLLVEQMRDHPPEDEVEDCEDKT